MIRLKHVIVCLIGTIAFSQMIFAQKIDVYSRPLQSERSRDYDAIHYKVRLRFDENTKTFWGENTITISPLKDDFNTCLLDAETFTVTSVKDHHGQDLSFRQPEHQLVVKFPQSYEYGDTLTFTVSYLCENMTADPTRFGMGRNYAIGLTFVEETENNPRLIQALSFPTGARHWYPCYDHPNDKATQEMIVTVSKEYKALSNGKLIEMKEEKEKGTKTFHWLQDLPHPTYLSLLVAGPYMVIKDSLGPLPINYWVYPKDEKDALRSFQKTPHIIEFFNQEFGYPYPWAKYDQITIPGIGGGAECTSATLIGQSTIHDEKAEKDFPSHWLVAHEAAHQWWGDLVTLRDWGHTWINESFGTYFEYIYAKHALGKDEGALNLLNKKNSYLNEAHNRYIRPIVFHQWNFPGENFDRHTYPKGAAVIHMMRWILGEAPFKKTIAHFLHKHAFQPADTHDFLTAVKETTGRNLDWFFDQWLYKPGHPVFEVEYDWDSQKKVLSLRIEQVQDADKGIPIYKTPLMIGIVTSAGKRVERVRLKNQLEEFKFPCDHLPLLVRFDEGNFLLKEWKFEKSTDELIYQLEHDDVIGRKWAAAELAGFSENEAAWNGLVNSAAEDDFWAVREEAVKSIGTFTGYDKVKILKQKAVDPNSKVRAAAFRALGDLKRKDLAGFLKERFKKDDSYVAQAEILRAMGQCGDKDLIGFLKNAAALKSPRNVLKNAATRALEDINRMKD